VAVVSGPVELGIGMDGFLMVLRIEEDGRSAFVRPDDEPETVLVAAPDVVVALAAGGISIEQALAVGEFRVDSDILRTVFAAGGTRGAPPAPPTTGG
jgi:putative sterol carrier protein